ncbi:hypothetical protein BGV40_09085 [Methanosarcina sp. Ant1]|nr:hypothetical protein BGV40_09085 [Methanosarcina sp. Ant1]
MNENHFNNLHNFLIYKGLDNKIIDSSREKNICELIPKFRIKSPFLSLEKYYSRIKEIALRLLHTLK